MSAQAKKVRFNSACLSWKFLNQKCVAILTHRAEKIPSQLRASLASERSSILKKVSIRCALGILRPVGAYLSVRAEDIRRLGAIVPLRHRSASECHLLAFTDDLLS